ncbi:MAG: hypothetical protein Ta2E_10440 [Mycoplasmoidaceae bacterium]|nr:MAG: hypothetical protein Ta2E_10440 [Mycoplasmoidaceae bacterium]
MPLVHRFEADAFLEIPTNLTQVDHINRIQMDSIIENLRLTIRSIQFFNKVYQIYFVEFKIMWEELAIQITKYGNPVFYRHLFSGVDSIFYYLLMIKLVIKKLMLIIHLYETVLIMIPMFLMVQRKDDILQIKNIWIKDLIF